MTSAAIPVMVAKAMRRPECHFVVRRLMKHEAIVSGLPELDGVGLGDNGEM